MDVGWQSQPIHYWHLEFFAPRQVMRKRSHIVYEQFIVEVWLHLHITARTIVWPVHWMEQQWNYQADMITSQYALICCRVYWRTSLSVNCLPSKSANRNLGTSTSTKWTWSTIDSNMIHYSPELDMCQRNFWDQSQSPILISQPCPDPQNFAARWKEVLVLTEWSQELLRAGC